MKSAGVAVALASGLLFGLVSVAGKTSDLHPLLLGGSAYALAGILLSPSLRRLRVAAADRPKLLLMSLVGGAVAPALLFYGLQRTAALHASLLLTLEMVFTAVLARVFLRERLAGPALAGVGLLFASALLVASATATREAAQTDATGALLVTLAALGWGVDNTVSARLLGSYEPHRLVAAKGILGGAAALAAYALITRRVPVVDAADVRAALYIGVLGIGASIVLFYRAVRAIGATRTSAVFLPVSALAGVAAARLVLGEPFGILEAVATALVAGGIAMLARKPADPASGVRKPGALP